MSDGPSTPTPEPIVMPDDRLLARQMGARLIARFEGFSPTPYQDQGGTWTIGFGTIRIDGQPVTGETAPVSRSEGLVLLESDLRQKAAFVDASVLVYATVNQLAALYSFTYNEGEGAERSSSVLRFLNEGQTLEAANAFLLWDMITDPATGKLVFDQGLYNRRCAERAVFLGKMTA